MQRPDSAPPAHHRTAYRCSGISAQRQCSPRLIEVLPFPDGHSVHPTFFYGNKYYEITLRFCEFATSQVADNQPMLKTEEIQAVLADQLRPVKPWLDRKDVTELMINPGGHVYVEANGVITYEGQLLSPGSIDIALTAVAKFVGQDSRADAFGTASMQHRQASAGGDFSA